MWRSRSFHIFGATTTNARSALWTILDSCTVIAAWPGSHSAVPPSLSVGLCVSCPLQCGSSMVMNGSSSLCSGSSSLASYSYHCCVDWGGAEKEKDEVIHKRLDCYFIFSAVNNNVTFHLCEAADCQQRLQEQWFVLQKARLSWGVLYGACTLTHIHQRPHWSEIRNRWKVWMLQSLVVIKLSETEILKRDDPVNI